MFVRAIFLAHLVLFLNLLNDATLTILFTFLARFQFVSGTYRAHWTLLAAVTRGWSTSFPLDLKDLLSWAHTSRSHRNGTWSKLLARRDGNLNSVFVHICCGILTTPLLFHCWSRWLLLKNFAAELAHWDHRFTLGWISLLTDEGSQLGDRVNQSHVKRPANVYSWTVLFRRVLVQKFKFIFAVWINLVLWLQDGV